MINYIQGDVMTYSFEPASFDIVTSVAALHHLDARAGRPAAGDVGVASYVPAPQVLRSSRDAHQGGADHVGRWVDAVVLDGDAILAGHQVVARRGRRRWVAAKVTVSCR